MVIEFTGNLVKSDKILVPRAGKMYRKVSSSPTPPDSFELPFEGKLSQDNRWVIMASLPGKIQLIVAQLYSLRTWIEYGFKQVKNELGWADFRLTDYASIERWWEIVFSSYLLVSLQANSFQAEASTSHLCIEDSSPSLQPSLAQFRQHPWWEPGTTWKSALNNLRLIIQPYIFYCLISPWLQVFKIPGFQRGFLKLISLMNQFRASPVPFAIAS